jgi:hypothetical protein
MNKYIADFLHSFFRTFYSSIKSIEFNGDNASGVITYDDDSGEQSFLWRYPQNYDLIVDSILILDFLNENMLINGDQILLTKEDLISRMSLDKNRSETAINFLVNIRIMMIDGGSETDSFFIHF